MSNSTYMSYEIDPNDSVEEKQKKLYLAICGMGDWLYQQGAAINEMNKEYLRWEKELNTYRQEMRNIRHELNKRGEHNGYGKMQID